MMEESSVQPSAPSAPSARCAPRYAVKVRVRPSRGWNYLTTYGETNGRREDAQLWSDETLAQAEAYRVVEINPWCRSRVVVLDAANPGSEEIEESAAG